MDIKISYVFLMRAWHSPGASFETGVRTHCAEVLFAHRTYSVLRWFRDSWLSFVSSGCCPSYLAPRWLLMIFHRSLPFDRSGSGSERIPGLFVGVSGFVVFPLSAAIPICRSIDFHPFWTVCLRNRSAMLLHFDWQAVCWADGDRESRFVYLLSSLSVVFFTRKLLKSFLYGCSSRLVGGSHNQVQLCRHSAGFKTARFLSGPLKMGC